MPTGRGTNYGYAQIMNLMFGGAQMNIPQTWYIAYAMGTSSPSSMGAEPNGAGYARKAVLNTGAFWNTSISQHKTNQEPILWAPAESNQGNVQSVILYDSPVNGNPWFYFPLNEPKVIEDGDAMTIPVGALSIDFTSGLFSNTVKNQLLNYIMGGTQMFLPANYYLGYTTSASSDTTPGSEPTSGGYARINVPNASGVFTSSATGNKTTALDLTFPEATASQGTAVGVAFFTAITGGTFVAHASMPNRAIDQATTPFIPAGLMDLMLS